VRNEGPMPRCAPLMRAGVFQKAETVPVLKATCSKRLPPHYFDPFSPLICSRCLGSPINYQNYLAGCRPRATRSFCFGKRTPKSPPTPLYQRGGPDCRGPLGKLRHDTKLYGCATRCAQTALAEKSIRYGGLAAPEGGRKCLEPSLPRSLVPFNPIDQLTGTSSTTPVSHFDYFLRVFIGRRSSLFLHLAFRSCPFRGLLAPG